MLLIKSINAIKPWECYEYQGHVTLYIALKKIYNLLQSGESTSNYDVQIEGEEDFSIRNDDKYISLHQVKAGAIKLESNDKFSFVMGILQNEADYGYFHILNGKKMPVDFVSTTLDYMNMLKGELNKKVIEKKDIPSTDKEADYIVLDKVSENHKKADVYSIIKYVSGNAKDITKIESAIVDINNALCEYKTIIEGKMKAFKRDNPSRNDDEAYLCAYDEKFDNAKEIRIKAYDLIVEILKIKCPTYSFVDVDYASLVYDKLFLYMKAKMTDFNISNEKNGRCILTFDEIVNQIIVDYHNEIDTVAYQYFQVLRSIRDAYAEYPKAVWNNCTESNCKDCHESNICNLFEQIRILNEKSDDDKNKIIHNLILQTPQKGKSNNLPSDSLVLHLFLNLLDEIKFMTLGKNNVYEAIKDGGITYRLTLDSSYTIEEFQRNLGKELKKDVDKKLLYECDVLITDKLCEKNLFFNGEDVNVLTEKELNEISKMTSSSVENIKKDSTRPKIIRLVDKNKALGELK